MEEDDDGDHVLPRRPQRQAKSQTSQKSMDGEKGGVLPPMDQSPFSASDLIRSAAAHPPPASLRFALQCLTWTRYESLPTAEQEVT